MHRKSLDQRVIFADFNTRISPRVISWHIGEVLPLMIGDLFAVGAFDLMRFYLDSFNENFRLNAKNLLGLPKGFMPHTTLSRILMYHDIGVETFSHAAISGKNLMEFSTSSEDQIREALHMDSRGRPNCQFDAHLQAALL